MTVTRVLVVDDSAVVRSALIKAIGEDPLLTVVGSASNPLEAWDLIEQTRPDVLTLDVEMPGMDGITFLQRLMKTRPMAVVIVSSKGRRSAKIVMDALQAGALAVIPKPYSDYPLPRMISDLKTVLHDAKAARPRFDAMTAPASPAPPPRKTSDLEAGRNAQIIAVGSSTGGTVAFETLARGLPRNHPPVVVAQHLPPDFIPRFAERLAEILPGKVSVAKGGEPLLPGEVWIAPGSHHLRVRQSGARLVTDLYDAPPVNYHRPSVEVLLESVARVVGRNAIGVMLTGMGSDGARGLLAMRNAGAATLGQDQQSCVVYGMPRAAKELGAVQEELPIEQLAPRISGILGPQRAAAR